MLWLYTNIVEAKLHFARQHPSLQIMDWSDSTPAELVSQAETVLQHHKKIGVYLGYLDGWMLSLTEEIRLRPLIRAFPVCMVTRWPCAVSLAWKYELEYVNVSKDQQDGHPNLNNDGRAGPNPLQDEHRDPVAQPTDSAPPPEGGKAGSAPKRRKRKGQDQAAGKDGGTEA